MTTGVLFWIVFNVIIVTVLILDLGVLNRKAHKIALKEALIWSGVWISIALIFKHFCLLSSLARSKRLNF